jgi:hypothetical protein
MDGFSVVVEDGLLLSNLGNSWVDFLGKRVGTARGLRGHSPWSAYELLFVSQPLGEVY